MSTTINKNLGHVTAYAYAKAGGYTGTEAEFQALLGNIAIDLSEIENLTVVVNTLPAGSSATASYSDGVLTLGIPRGDTGEVSEADLATALEDYVEKTMLDDYAQVDGYYSEMTVGDAEQLISSMYVEDAEPYNYRTTGGSADVGNREYVDAIVGGAIVWNQLVRISSGTKTDRGVTATIDTSTGVISLSGTSATSFAAVFDNFSAIKGHKYIRTYKVLTNPNSVVIRPHAFNIDWNGVSEMVNASDTIRTSCGVAGFTSGTVLDGITMKVNFFDLTQMFGSTIADYIYGLEQANAGAGVAWFKKLFPKDYYEYNAGELISVSGLQSHDIIGFNMWDEEWEVGGYSDSTGEKVLGSSRLRNKNKISCIPSTTYFFASVGSYTSWVSIYFYDADENYISITALNVNRTFTTPSNAQYMCFNTSDAYGTTYKHDICINISWSGWRNGEYEPYEKHSYSLDSSLTLRGIPKLDAQNNLYYDGDEYKADGSVTRKYGVVDLGTLGWVKYSSSNYDNLFYAALPTLCPTPSVYEVANILCVNYKTTTQALVGTSGYTNKYISGSVINAGNARFWLNDEAYTEASAIKSALNGVMVVYELAAPTTETAESYQHIQICNDFGTEEFVSTSIVPVGHSTRYPANLRDKLQHLPNLADNDGYYMIGQTNKQMHLELFRIPKAPTTDGTYTLKATVSGGTPTYTWEAEE